MSATLFSIGIFMFVAIALCVGLLATVGGGRSRDNLIISLKQQIAAQDNLIEAQQRNVEAQKALADERGRMIDALNNAAGNPLGREVPRP